MVGKKKSEPQLNWDHPKSDLGASPKPFSEMTTINGRKVSSRNYNGRGWTSNIEMLPEEQKTMVSSSRNINQLLPSIRSNIFTNPQEQERFTNALYEPQRQNLLHEYQNLLGDANASAQSLGTRDSLGFENFRAKQLDRNLGENLGKLYNQSYMQSFQLPQMKLAPIQQAIGMYSGLQGDIQNRNMQLLDPSFQGSQAGTNWAMGRYNAEQQQLLNQLNDINSQRQTQGRGFLGSIFS